jgi:streptogramin lyase
MPLDRATPVVFSLIAAAIVALPSPGHAQVPKARAEQVPGTVVYPPRPTRLRPLRHSRVALLAASPTSTVVESEPNDSASKANVVMLADTATGTINPAGDVDYFALDVPAGTTLGLDVNAARAGSSLDATLTLIGTDSTTVLAFNDDFNGTDSYIEYTVGTAGRYFVLIASYDGSGGAAYTYALSFGVVLPGPGDPTTLYASGLGAPYGMAAGPAGEVYVADPDSLRLLRVAPNGQVTVLASFTSTTELPIGVVVDGTGDVLVSTVDTGFTHGKIVRLGGNQRSTFASDLESGAAITIGPDGDVWVIDPVAGLLRRYDPAGGPKGSTSLSAVGNVAFEMGLAFSPSGDLYLSNAYDAIYKVVSGVPQSVYQGSPYLEGIAFDKDGYLYVGNGFEGRMILLDPNLQPVNDPFARSHLGGPIQVAFLRDAGGAMTARLLADNVGYHLTPPYVGGIVEMNPTGMRASGFRIGIDLLRVANATLRDGVVGADYADTLRLTTAPGPVTWSLFSGTLPPGLTLSAAGELSGVATQGGGFTFAVRADAGGQSGYKAFAVTITVPSVSVDAASQHLLGGAQLDPALQRYLDLQGNKDGRFDVGDFRAFLRANGQLPATAVARKEHP